MKKIVVIILGLAAVGCSTLDFSDMNRGLDRLKGKDINTAITILGRPNTKQKQDKDTVFIWHTVSSSKFRVLKQNEYGRLVTERAPESWRVKYKCVIKIVTSENSIVKDWSYDGNYGDCRKYMKNYGEYDDAEKDEGG